MHEFGHLSGFRHSDSASPYISDPCQSVMTAAIDSGAETCYQPKAHDIADMEAVHPNA